MYIAKNAIKNLFRNKGRNLLIFLILLATVTSVTTCALIEGAAKKQVQNYRDSFRISAYMDGDMERIAKDFPATPITDVLGNTLLINLAEPDIGIDAYDYIASPYVDYHTAMICAGYYNSSFKYIPQRNIIGDTSQYYGKDMAFFRTLVKGWINEQEAYVRSKVFADTGTFKQLFGVGHVLTDDEVSMLVARLVFGDIHYQEYLDNGKKLTDNLVELAWNYKTVGSPEVLGGYLNETMDIRAGSTDAMLIGFAGANSDIQDGRISLAEGREAENAGECIIGQEFAKLNSLSIGSKITLENCHISEGIKKIELTVTGIYSADAWDATHSTSESPDPNNIYTTEQTVKNWGVGFGVEDLKLFFKSEEDLASLGKQMRSDGLNDYFGLKSNVGKINAAIEPLEGVSKMFGTLMIVILIIGGAVFLLLTFLAVCERKYEIGVLRAIGMKKKGVIVGFICETALIVLICCILGLTFGTLVAQPVFHAVAPAQLDIAMQNQIGINSMFNSSELDLTDAVTAAGVKQEAVITTNLSLPIVLEIVGVCLLLMLIAILISGLYITRFEPLKILSDQE